MSMSGSRSALCDRAESILVVIDLQERLAAAMPPDARERTVRNTGILLQAAGKLGVPALLTEQYRKGLGPTVSEVSSHAGESVRSFEKTCFSCRGADGFPSAISDTGRRQLVLTGMEAHVCVLQTAIELLGEGREVFVVEDACCSRLAANHQNAMNRLRQAGAVVANTESVLFEWLRDARHEQFKAISRLVR